MDAYTSLKTVHMVCAVLSVSGFMLRGIWMLTDSPVFRHPATKVVPHMVDTILLLSAIAMLLVASWNPFDYAWLMAKILALLLYIFLGLVAFRFASNRAVAGLAWLGALLTVFYIVHTALTKSPYLFQT